MKPSKTFIVSTTAQPFSGEQAARAQVENSTAATSQIPTPVIPSTAVPGITQLAGNNPPANCVCPGVIGAPVTTSANAKANVLPGNAAAAIVAPNIDNSTFNNGGVVGNNAPFNVAQPNVANPNIAAPNAATPNVVLLASAS